MVGKGTITMRETRILEFKETITNTFLKTVSAFSNYNGGTILFGVDDNGNVKGLPDVKQACLDIENKINDSISPQPNYTLEIQNNDQTIKLTVKSGLQKPYLYKSKAYKRNDTATIEVDTLEFSRLVLDGKNISFEELPCKDQELSFKILQCKLKENIYIETFNQDTLKTLNLYDNINGYNNAAGLLADKNHFSGIDIVKFGENISIIQKRVTFEHISVLEIYEKALAVFRDYYQYEVIQGADRKMVEKIPEAFESTMKIICDKQRYAYDKNKDTAQKLITILENNGFYSSYMNAHLTSIRTTLETGLPVVRNKVAGHGQGNQIITIPDEYTEYALHLAATNILFLVRLYRNKKQNL